jgi:hypothetical protein
MSLAGMRDGADDEGAGMKTVAEVLKALHRTADQLTSLTRRLTAGRPGLRSSCGSRWTVAQVLSHLGSGAEIGPSAAQAGLGVGVGAAPACSDRWDALSPEKMTEKLAVSEPRYLDVLDGLDGDQRAPPASIDG